MRFVARLQAVGSDFELCEPLFMARNLREAIGLGRCRAGQSFDLDPSTRLRLRVVVDGSWAYEEFLVRDRRMVCKVRRAA